MNRKEAGIQLLFPKDVKGFGSMVRREIQVRQAGEVLRQAISQGNVVLVDVRGNAIDDGLYQAIGALKIAASILELNLETKTVPGKFVDNESGRQYYTDPRFTVSINRDNLPDTE